MLPKFEIKEYGGRFFVETNWVVDNGTSAMSARTTVQVTSSGKLDTASAGWATRAKAEKAIEQCKARLR